MGTVVIDISMSLDGFVTAADQTPEQPMGPGGDRLHEWAFGGGEADQEVMASGSASAGAIITGRRTYDTSVPWWGSGGPSGEARLPVFVLSHSVPDDVPDDSVYRFVDDPVAALKQAQAESDDKVVCVMGGAEVAGSFLDAGLVDELSIHLVPVLLGGGTRLFADGGVVGVDHDRQVRLENVSAVQTPAATHLRFRVLR